jgi:hypothetical protein
MAYRPPACERYGNRSHVWLWRKDKTDPLFPKPMWLDGKKHYAEDQLDAYDLAKMANGDAPLLFGVKMDLAASQLQQAGAALPQDGSNESRLGDHLACENRGAENEAA